jgi:hypothetical protein
MQAVYEGYYEGVDDFGRMVIAHNDSKLNHIPWFKWTSKIIGKASVNFIGIKFDHLALPEEFGKGDRVKIHITVHRSINRETGQEYRKLVINKMQSI